MGRDVRKMSICGHFEKWDTEEFYITYAMEFSVRSWWPSVLWQPVTLWLVKRWMAERRDSQVQQVCNRMETTSRIGTRSDLERVQRIRNRAGDTRPIRGVRSSLTIRLAIAGTRWLLEEDMWQDEVLSLSICLSIYLSNLQKLGVPFENKMRDISL